MRFSLALGIRDRIKYLITRALGYLPAGILVKLSGEPAIVVDGKQFDPHAQLLRTFRRRLSPHGLVEPTVEAGRKRYRFDTRVFRGPVTRVQSVRDFDIGGLRARHYVPIGGSSDVTVYMHGGGFVLGDLDTHDEPCRMLCAHARVHVLSVDYRLAPEHPFPAGLDDTCTAVRWAQQNAGMLGADPRRVSVAGDSAGANLAAVASRACHPRPVAQLLLYPPTDSVNHRASYDLFGSGFVLTMKDRSACGRHYSNNGIACRGDDPRVSPLHAPDLDGLPAALVVTAMFDLLRDEGDAYADALERAGNLVKRHRVPSLGHGFVHMTGVNRAARRALIEIAREWRDLLASQDQKAESRKQK